MKAKFLRAFAALLIVAALLAPCGALGAARYPADGGVVVDDANALSERTLKDIADFADEVDDETDVKLHVALVHFLDGLDAQTYASNLFARWGLGDSDFLLLGAVGEDVFASVSGAEVKAKLSDANAQNLLFSSGFSEQFKAQQYDAAFGKYFLKLAETLDKQFSADIEVGDLFADYQERAEAQATAQPTATPRPYAYDADDFGSNLWSSVMDSVESSVDQYNHYQQQRQSENGGGLSGKGWVVLGIIILIIFSQSDPARKARRKGGCGCGPLGWLFGLLGLSSLFGRGGNRGPGPGGPGGPHGPGRHRW